MKYRMYIDECGSADLKSNSTNNRFLSLTGLIFNLQYVADVAHPEIESLKYRFFGAHPDETICLHRKELVNKKPPFQALLDPAVEALFNDELLRLFRDLEYQVVTAVIDKHELKERHAVWQADPYHYCLRVLVERFVMWLERIDARGDVMAESRGGSEDQRLKNSFSGLYEDGSEYVSDSRLQARLTSKQLKVKPKVANVCGLQLADLSAHPSFVATKARHDNRALPTTFGGKIAEIFEATKYDRSPGGKIDGWGRKWLP